MNSGSSLQPAREKEAIALFRDAFGLSGIDALRAIKCLKDTNHPTEKNLRSLHARLC